MKPVFPKLKGFWKNRKGPFLFWVASTAAVAVLALFYACLPKPDLWEGVSQSSIYRDRNGKLLRLTLSSDSHYRLRVPLDRISPRLVEATLLHEDRYFYSHPGVNPVALGKALLNEISRNSNRFGASTVTMQLARIRFQLNTKNLEGKLVQSFRALQLERHYSKNEILEAYLNQASYGRNIEGVEAASLIYYGKKASDLNLAEAVTLSVIPQSPARRAPRYAYEDAAANAGLLQAREKLFARWIREHPEDSGQVAALKMALQVRTPRDLPFLAPHFIEWQKPEKNERTSLDLGLQQLCERQISSFVEKRRDQGIRNASALLVDTRTMEVRAAVGSADFFSKEIEGQVNGITMHRSPGSTLKPLLYALAMDEGLIQPHSLLKDAPLMLAGYNPENYDRDFAGPISAEAALQQSRNVPAVWLASQLKKKTLYSLLQGTGVHGLKEESHYGLTLALGSAEMSMVELAQLYGMLANGGQFRTLNAGDSDPETLVPPKQLLGKESCFLVLDMLKHMPRPGAARSEGLREGTNAVAWKTGTSWSFRDAWSVAVFDRFVLVVWVGNFDGESNAALVGRQTAAPLLFSIIDGVRGRVGVEEHPAWESRAGLNIEVVDLCPVSGELAGPLCDRKMSGYFIPGVSPINTCNVHQAVFVDVETGKRVLGKKEGRDIRREVYEVWPPDIRELFRKAGLPRRDIPSFAREVLPESGARDPDVPLILSPKGGVSYSMVEGTTDSRRQLAVKGSGAGTLHWFANVRLLGATKPGEVLLWEPQPGDYTLTVVSDSGMSSSEKIRIEGMP